MTENSCLKGRGFNFEDTHLTDPDRIGKLTVLLAIAFAWPHKVEDWRHSHVKKIRRKKHGRLAKRGFRYGLGWIQQALCGDRVHQKSMATCMKLLANCGGANRVSGPVQKIPT